MDHDRRRTRAYLSLAVAGGIFVALPESGLAIVPNHVVSSSSSQVGDPVIAAAGDIACDPSSSSFKGGNGTASVCRAKYTGAVLSSGGFTAVLALGDEQYECGGYQAFAQSYDQSWGPVKSITFPAVGNHEYASSGGTDCGIGASGYFQYFGPTAGDPSQGYYSFEEVVPLSVEV